MDKEVGHCDALVGKMNGVPFHVHAMKEPDYVMMLMSTYGTLTRMGKTKKALHWKWHEESDRIQVPRGGI